MLQEIIDEMLLLQLLTLCLAAVVHLTSSQPTVDVTVQDSCDFSESFKLTVLTALTQLQRAHSQLQKELAELKAKRTTVTWKNQTGKSRYTKQLKR